jgi:hypothetical protein
MLSEDEEIKLTVSWPCVLREGPLCPFLDHELLARWWHYREELVVQRLEQHFGDCEGVGYERSRGSRLGRT